MLHRRAGAQRSCTAVLARYGGVASYGAIARAEACGVINIVIPRGGHLQKSSPESRRRPARTSGRMPVLFVAASQVVSVYDQSLTLSCGQGGALAMGVGRADRRCDMDPSRHACRAGRAPRPLHCSCSATSRACACAVRLLCASCVCAVACVHITSHSWMTKYVRRAYRAILRQLVYSVLVSNMTMSRIKACRCRAMYSAPAHTVRPSDKGAGPRAF